MVQSSLRCSDKMVSRLVELFATRGGRSSSASPEEVMSALVSRLRSRYRGDGVLDDRMRFYLRSRKIVSVRMVKELDYAAALEPIGDRYAQGFNVLLKQQSSHVRLRFSLAHEICHTFFYEHVPEIKYFLPEIDAIEEHLCDFGAAELLMPSFAVKKLAAQQPVCIESLRTLAEQFAVSVAAMFLRLRFFRLWSCVFSEWQRMLSGRFELANIYGGRRLPWEWDDPSILAQAWESHSSSFGDTVLRYEIEEGRPFYSPAKFQVQRVGNRIFAIWGPQIERPPFLAPLFASTMEPKPKNGTSRPRLKTMRSFAGTGAA